MKKVLTMVLAIFLVLSLSGAAFAGDVEDPNTEGTTPVVLNAGAADYTVTIPEELKPGETVGDVSVTGSWSSAEKLTVSAPDTVELYLHISNGNTETKTDDFVTATVNFNDMEQKGDSFKEKLSSSASVSVDKPAIMDSIKVGTWKGSLVFTISLSPIEGYQGGELSLTDVTITGLTADKTYNIINLPNHVDKTTLPENTVETATETAPTDNSGTTIIADETGKATVTLPPGEYALENGGTYWQFVVTGAATETVTPDKITIISTKEELFAFAKSVNGGEDITANTYGGEIIYLADDIDLNNEAWTPIGQTENGNHQFQGIFDGQGHTISNLKINNEAKTANCASGLFGWVENGGSAVIKNVNVDTAKVTGHHNVAVIAGYISGSTLIENCWVTNAEVTCTHANDDACGDKAGIIVGIIGGDNAYVKNCKATESTVKAGRDAGQIVGAATAGKDQNVQACSATNVEVTATEDCTGANINNAIIGRT